MVRYMISDNLCTVALATDWARHSAAFSRSNSVAWTKTDVTGGGIVAGRHTEAIEAVQELLRPTRDVDYEWLASRVVVEHRIRGAQAAAG